MTTQEIANKLYELCKTNQFEQAHSELYANDAVSIENNMEGVRETMVGIDAMNEKSKKMYETIEQVHSEYTNEPKVFGPYIFMEMGMDVTMKGVGRVNMIEMCKYEVKDGKIISEEFFY